MQKYLGETREILLYFDHAHYGETWEILLYVVSIHMMRPKKYSSVDDAIVALFG
jgi:hypothetical protein